MRSGRGDLRVEPPQGLLQIGNYKSEQSQLQGKWTPRSDAVEVFPTGCETICSFPALF